MSDNPHENARGLYYNIRVNRFEDDNGNIIHDLSKWFPTWQLDAWKKKKEYALLKDRTGEFWDLFYDSIIPYCECKHHCFICPTQCEIYDLVRGGEYNIL